MNVILGLLLGALGLLAAAFKLQGNKLKKERAAAKELNFRLEKIEVMNEIKRLEKQARESNTIADDLWSKYHDKRDPSWRPDGDK